MIRLALENNSDRNVAADGDESRLEIRTQYAWETSVLNSSLGDENLNEGSCSRNIKKGCQRVLTWQ